MEYGLCVYLETPARPIRPRRRFRFDRAGLAQGGGIELAVRLARCLLKYR